MICDRGADQDRFAERLKALPRETSAVGPMLAGVLLTVTLELAVLCMWAGVVLLRSPDWPTASAPFFVTGFLLWATVTIVLSGLSCVEAEETAPRRRRGAPDSFDE